MSQPNQAIYTGPGKTFLGQNNVALQANGATGPVKLSLNEKTDDAGASQFGKLTETEGDMSAEIDVTPFPSWSLLPSLFPPFLGVTTASGPGYGAGALAIGTRPHGSVNVASKIWTPDGRLYTACRTAIIGHPPLKLGTGENLFGAVKISCLQDRSTAQAPILAITESGAPDPGGVFTLADFIRGRWYAAWGTNAGFGGDGGALMEGEDGIDIVPDIKYSPRLIQKVTAHYVLDSVAFMVKLRPAGPTQTQINAAILAHTTGSRYGAGINAAPLVLTGPNAKTITTSTAEIKGAGFEFGGTKLGNGEIGFVVAMNFTNGVPQPLLTFSA
jgi:hypothetical protein